MSQVNPGWYPDPDGKPCDRFGNVTSWTLETRPRTSTHSISPPSQNGMSVGWKVAIGVGFFFCLLILAFAASEPSFWY